MHRKYNDYDVIVVGAGPAGSVISYLLAQNGVSVLLLEKYKLPRYKACGGGINVRTARLIPFDISESVENTIYGAMISKKSDTPKLRKYNKPLSYMVMRDRFDYLLTRQAQAVGVKVIDQSKVISVEIETDGVIVKTTNSDYTASIVVGADGAYSVVARSSSLAQKPNRGMAIDCQITVDDQTLAKWDGLVGLEFGRMYGGYSWIFPKQDSLSVGIGGHHKYRKYLKPRLYDFIEKQHFHQRCHPSSYPS